MITDDIKDRILDALPGSEAYVLDPRQDGKHFEAIVISSEFVGLSLVKQHQKVMNALKQEFAGDVHALSLKTFTPDKWELEKDNYNLGGHV